MTVTSMLLLPALLSCGNAFSSQTPGQAAVTDLRPPVTVAAAGGRRAGPGTDQVRAQVVFDANFAASEPGTFPAPLRLTGLNPARERDPVVAAYREFCRHAVVKAQRDVIAEIRRLAREADIAEFAVTGNHSTRNPCWPWWVGLLDGVQPETDFSANRPDDPDVLVQQQLLSAVDLPMCMLGGSVTNRRLQQQGDDPEFYMMMAAQCYAQGHNLMVPYNLYDGSFSTRYYGRVESHAPLYRFVRDHETLLDGYRPMTETAVVFAVGKHPTSKDEALQRVVMECLANHRPMRLVPAGEPFPVLRQGDLAGAIVHILGDEADYRTEDWSVVEAAAQPEPVKQLFALNRDRRAWLFPRVKPGAPEAPLVVHILNREATFEEAAGTGLTPLSGLELRFHERLVQGRAVERVTAHRIAGDAVGLEFRREDDYIVVPLPDIRLWTILAIEAGDQSGHPAAAPRRFPQNGQAFRESEVCLMRSGFRDFDAGQLPDHVRALLVDAGGMFNESRLLDMYGVSCVSWAYRHIREVRRPGVRYFGSTNAFNFNRGRYPDNWGGWAQRPDGRPLDRRPPQIVLSAATDEYREYLLTQAERQIENWRTNGLQWDGISGYARVLDYGGDFHPEAMRQFRDLLAGRFTPARRAQLGLADLSAFDFPTYLDNIPNPYFTVTEVPGAGRVLRLQRIPEPTEEHRFNSVLTPPLSASSGRCRFEVEFRAESSADAAGAQLGIYLLPGNGSNTFFSTVLLAHGPEKSVLLSTSGDRRFTADMSTWSRVVLDVDFDRAQVRLQLDGKRPLPELSFRQAPGPDTHNDFCFSLHKKPHTPDLLVRRIRVGQVPEN